MWNNELSDKIWMTLYWNSAELVLLKDYVYKIRILWILSDLRVPPSSSTS